MAQETTVLVRLLPYPVSGCTQLPGEKYWLSQFRKEFYIGKAQLHVPSTTSIAIRCSRDPPGCSQLQMLQDAMSIFISSSVLVGQVGLGVSVPTPVIRTVKLFLGEPEQTPVHQSTA